MMLMTMLPFVSSSTSKRHPNMMCSKSSERYKKIPLTIFKVIGIVSIFVAPIALLQVISATNQQQQQNLKQREEIRQDELVGQSYVDPRILAQSSLQPIEGRNDHRLHQLGELFDDVNNQHKDGGDSKSILLRLRRQTDDETRQHLAKLTASGAAAGMIFGDQMAAAQMAAAAEQANYHPGHSAANEDDDNGDMATGPTGENVDLSTLQSDRQQTSPYYADQAYSPIMAQDYHHHHHHHLQQQQQQQPQQQQQQEQQQDPDDKINLDHMPDSMDSLMRSEQVDMAVDPGDSEQPNNEQQQQQSSAAASSNQQQSDVRDGDGDEYSTNDNRNTLHDAQNLPRSYLPIQGGQPHSGLIQGTPIHLSGTIFPSGISSPIIDSSDDLNAAAGHHYKKKKKKKKVKKIIIKKKKKVKKYKKIKKIKVIKYKKKKVYKKKKKPMKHHHHHKHKHHHHDHGKYYMYAKVPKKKSWEFGFKKGNKKHWIERHEKGHKNKFKTTVKWYDKKSKGKGVHIWDYNHHDKKKKKHF